MDPPSLPDRGAVSDQGGQAGARGREDVQVVLRNATEQLATATDDNDDSYVWVHEEEVQVSLSPELLQRGPRALEEEVQAEAPALEEEAEGFAVPQGSRDTLPEAPRHPIFFCESEHPGSPPIFPQEPCRRTAAVNAGDYCLCLGGGGINKAFGELLQEQQGLGSAILWLYGKLHLSLLEASRAAGGILVTAADVFPARNLLAPLCLSAAFGQAGETMPDDTIPGATGAVFLDIFAEGRQPFGIEANAAMLYVVVPKGEMCRDSKNKDSADQLRKGHFLAFVERLSCRSLEAVVTYNRDWAGGVLVEEVRWCLVSGGKYCNKLDVASATLRGLLAAEGAQELYVTFTYNDDVFRVALDTDAKVLSRSVRVVPKLLGLRAKAPSTVPASVGAKAIAALFACLGPQVHDRPPVPPPPPAVSICPPGPPPPPDNDMECNLCRVARPGAAFQRSSCASWVRSHGTGGIDLCASCRSSWPSLFETDFAGLLAATESVPPTEAPLVSGRSGPVVMTAETDFIELDSADVTTKGKNPRKRARRRLVVDSMDSGGDRAAEVEAKSKGKGKLGQRLQAVPADP